MRVVVAAAVVCALGSTAHAEEWGGAAGIGAGVVGVEPVSAIDARGDLTWDGGALGP
jgi:hypothetical protein